MKSHMTSGLFSSRTDEWETPKDFFQKLDDEFHFDLDVCATPENAKCKRYFTKEQDGLKQEWKGTCWMNPPYGRQISLWGKKALDSARGATVVCLLPSRTDTQWWHSYVIAHASEVRFIKRPAEVRRLEEQCAFSLGRSRIQRKRKL